MLPDLPWFIWREIIDYTVSQQYQIYCLLNKEWFQYSAGQFLTIEQNLLCDNNQPPTWFKLAENLELTNSTKINWNFLSECRSLRQAEIKFNYKLNNDLNELRKFVLNSQLESVYFDFEDDEMEENIIFLLSDFSNRLRWLGIDCDSFQYTKLFTLDFSNIIEFEAYSVGGSICFDKIQQAMPKIQDLTIRVLSINFNKYPKKNLIFANLESLEIELDQLEPNNNFSDLFEIFYPSLKSCKLNFQITTFEKFPQLMPKLKLLTFKPFFDETSKVFVIDQSLPHLEELNIYCDIDDIDDGTVHVDLSKFPSLQKFEIDCNIELFVSDANFYSLLKYLKISTKRSYSYQSICKILPQLKESSFEYTILGVHLVLKSI